jgi:predicted alpha/beta superfamily hydrolase
MNSVKKKYPVLYLLDGIGISAMELLSCIILSGNRLAPEMIVVGVGNVDRNRDMSHVPAPDLPTSGGADKFLSFIGDELIHIWMRIIGQSHTEYYSGFLLEGLCLSIR